MTEHREESIPLSGVPVFIPRSSVFSWGIALSTTIVMLLGDISTAVLAGQFTQGLRGGGGVRERERERDREREGERARERGREREGEERQRESKKEKERKKERDRERERERQTEADRQRGRESNVTINMKEVIVYKHGNRSVLKLYFTIGIIRRRGCKREKEREREGETETERETER